MKQPAEGQETGKAQTLGKRANQEFGVVIRNLLNKSLFTPNPASRGGSPDWRKQALIPTNHPTLPAENNAHDWRPDSDTRGIGWTGTLDRPARGTKSTLPLPRDVRKEVGPINSSVILDVTQC